MNKSLLFLVCICCLRGCSRPEAALEPESTDLTVLQPIAAIDLAPNIPEPSGLAFNRKNNTLMVVSDAKSDIFEIDFSGSIKNKIATTSTDLEGVAITQNGDTLYVVEERNQRVVSYAKNGQRLNSISVRVATSDNSALEGIAIDNRRHLFVLNEKSPRLLLEFVGSAEVSRKEITAVKDLSGICYDESNDGLWIISDESKKIISISKTGILLGEWLVPFDKGEGIAFANGKMYIVNDDDGKLYVFDVPS
ncbi:MAG TPA: SdiA-regulated domain-containing protein [bacterium]|nr:SdiA-regulated domain-containing protein [bacterium]HNT65896.1 SdiA-regulated domain-containing protein [bacterium]